MDYGKLASTLTLAEGKKKSVYQDSLGFWTIGVGHLVDARKNAGLSEAAIQFILKEDMSNAFNFVLDKPYYKSCDTDARQRAIVELSFQLGPKLETFTTFLSLVTQKKWAEAANDLLNTAYAHQVFQRAKRISSMIATGNDV